jgi:hypothetical protein
MAVSGLTMKTLSLSIVPCRSARVFISTERGKK